MKQNKLERFLLEHLFSLLRLIYTSISERDIAVSQCLLQNIMIFIFRKMEQPNAKLDSGVNRPLQYQQVWYFSIGHSQLSKGIFTTPCDNDKKSFIAQLFAKKVYFLVKNAITLAAVLWHCFMAKNIYFLVKNAITLATSSVLSSSIILIFSNNPRNDKFLCTCNLQENTTKPEAVLQIGMLQKGFLCHLGLGSVGRS